MIAERQHGVVTAAQLRQAGLDEAAVHRATQAARLHRLHQGVYAVGHRGLSWRGRWLAAVLASGDGAVLSHSSAVALWQFLRPIPGPVHVTVGAAVRRKPRAGIRMHRSRTLAPRDVTRRHGIPVTTPARTIEDIRGEVDDHPSWDYHRGSVAFEDDHERDLRLRAHGIAVRRYTGDQLEAAPEAVVADLRQALGLAQAATVRESSASSSSSARPAATSS